MAIELKPCPFCGKCDFLFSWGNVQCVNLLCSVKPCTHEESAEAATRVWNTRPADTTRQMDKDQICEWLRGWFNAHKNVPPYEVYHPDMLVDFQRYLTTHDTTRTALVEALKLEAAKLTHAEAEGDSSWSWSPCDASGGNYDDAYRYGEDDGIIRFTRATLRAAGVEL